MRKIDLSSEVIADAIATIEDLEDASNFIYRHPNSRDCPEFIEKVGELIRTRADIDINKRFGSHDTTLLFDALQRRGCDGLAKYLIEAGEILT